MAAEQTSVEVDAIRVMREILREGLHKIEHCVSQLSDDQLWWRPRPEMNSIANLLLHLSGNVRQWVIAPCTGVADVRNRPAEFGDNSRRPKEQVLEILRKTITEADAAMARVAPERLTQRRHIQGYDVTLLEAIFNSVSHFRGHVQEIIHMTREQLGERYRFDFVPKGEQVAAHGPAL
jgi:hypothetical protein